MHESRKRPVGGLPTQISTYSVSLEDLRAGRTSNSHDNSINYSTSAPVVSPTANSHTLGSATVLSPATNALYASGSVVSPTANSHTHGSGKAPRLTEKTSADLQDPTRSASFRVPTANDAQATRGISNMSVSSARDLGRLVRIARERMQLNQQRFADLAGVGRRFISELENGKESLELAKVLQVCQAAGIDLFAKRRQRT
jgi:HTH-type transcriptional regulator/antitoxin HipB